MQGRTSLEKAQDLLLNTTPVLDIVQVRLESALGRIIAEDICADSPLPGQDQSAVDGYALGSPQAAVNDRFRLISGFKLGRVPTAALKPEEAVGIATGGILPKGCRAVVPHEKSAINGSELQVLEVLKPGQNVKRAGEDYTRGEVLVTAKTRLGPGHIALLAAYGVEKVEVSETPRVGVFSLGSNVVPWQAPLHTGQTRDSNAPMLCALVQGNGGLVTEVHWATGRDGAEITAALADMLRRVDLMICTGGSYLHGASEIQRLMESIGAQSLYWDVPVQPGSHTGAARSGSRLLFALSGNPAACFVGYHLFVAPVLRALGGEKPLPEGISARCSNGFPKAAGSRRLVRGYAQYTPYGWEVEVLPGQKPSMIRSLVDCNALIDIPAGHPPVEPGKDVSIILL